MFLMTTEASSGTAWSCMDSYGHTSVCPCKHICFLICADSNLHLDLIQGVYKALHDE